MLRSQDAVLVVVDVQNRLLPQIAGREDLLANVIRAIRGFQIVGAPILVTEQYRRGLGATHPAIQHAMLDPQTADQPVDLSLPDDPHESVPRFEPLEKMSFSCADDPPFLEALDGAGRRQVVLCGIEAHVCVLQTALQLIPRGYEVTIVADAVSSRHPRNLEIALRRMEQEGAHLETAESTIFQMLEMCGTPAFKRWLQIIR
ncbi:MAG: hydrolase [Candidatus Eisenbacteria bacterium]